MKRMLYFLFACAACFLVACERHSASELAGENEGAPSERHEPAEAAPAPAAEGTPPTPAEQPRKVPSFFPESK